MKIRNITPVHVGDGEEIIPWEYAIEEEKLSVYPVEHIVRKLSESYKGQRLRNLLLSLRDGVKEKGFRSNFGNFMREQGINIEPLYRLPLKSQLKNGEYKPIKRFIKNIEGVYIPGSEVKGALRTVFLFGILYRGLSRKKPIHFLHLKELVSDIICTTPKDKFMDRAYALMDTCITRHKSINREDAKYDLFKALVVGDTNPAPVGEVLYVDNVTILGSSRRKFSEPHELLKPDSTFEISIEIDEDMKNALKKSTDNPYIDLLTEEFLHESALKFTKWILEEDKKFFERGHYKMPNSIDEVGDTIAKKKFPIRIGKHQGFLSTTIMKMLKLGDEELYKEFFQKVITKSNRPPNKTRKITESGDILGWCILEES